MTSPTQRTLKALRKQGWVAAVVEHWNPHAFIRQDLFGIGDALCLKPDETLLVQATGGSGNGAKRVRKLKGECAEMTKAWLGNGCRKLQVWCWVKHKPRGTKRPKWDVRITEIEGVEI